MTSSNGNLFRVTGHLCGEFTGPGQRPVTRSFDVFFDLRLNKRLSKQSWGWWFDTPSRPLWRHCNGTWWDGVTKQSANTRCAHCNENHTWWLCPKWWKLFSEDIWWLQIKLLIKRDTSPHCSCHISHYGDVIMSTIASQITSLTIVYSTVYSGVDQRKHQSSVALAYVRGIHRWPVNSPHKRPVTRKMLSLDDVFMIQLGSTL